MKERQCLRQTFQVVALEALGASQVQIVGQGVEDHCPEAEDHCSSVEDHCSLVEDHHQPLVEDHHYPLVEDHGLEVELHILNFEGHWTLKMEVQSLEVEPCYCCY